MKDCEHNFFKSAGFHWCTKCGKRGTVKHGRRWPAILPLFVAGIILCMMVFDHVQNISRGLQVFRIISGVTVITANLFCVVLRLHFSDEIE